MASRVLILRVDLDQLQRLTTIGAIASFLLAGMFIVGEILGWWNDVGEVGIITSIVSGVLLTVATLLLSATKGQAKAIATGVAESNRKLDGANAKLDGANAKLDGANAKLDGANGKLDEANRKLDDSNRKHDETNRKLDVMVALLTDIRDRLGRA